MTARVLVPVLLAVFVGLSAAEATAASDNPADLKRACEAGNAWSCSYLAVMHRHGRGAPRDDARALTLFVAACEGGNDFACGSVGEMTYAGIGIAANPAAGELLLRGACRRNNKWSCYSMRRLGIKPLTN